ncbi:hypothetical protein PAP_07935 [Palaeococcus pacificus DY20341]|uniref:Uncharacterized protein n=1 Tax=Palaeococcus pacificus DY20341 TaxID=1343739 RepID=A0A075LV17_9EURY|nr:hypothetical protein [Palaeococcus pacificus]AIF69976.1 hypothetical protein PAP_07935 [Palaeococcus pacificus DY20341]
MKFEVLSKEEMQELSKELSKAGIMNKTKEELGYSLEHRILIKGKFEELKKKIKDMEVEVLHELLEEVENAYNNAVLGWEVGEKKKVDELFDEAKLGMLIVLTALVEGGYLEESEEGLVLKEKPELSELELELRIPIDEVADVLEELEERLNAKLLTEFTLERKYYVEVLEVEKELIQEALEIAEEYATEESLADAMFVGIAKSTLADIILELVKKNNKKKELIETLLAEEPITIEGKREKVNIYFEEDALEDFLKELQTLGYIKVKGNKIWW